MSPMKQVECKRENAEKSCAGIGAICGAEFIAAVVAAAELWFKLKPLRSGGPTELDTLRSHWGVRLGAQGCRIHCWRRAEDARVWVCRYPPRSQTRASSARRQQWMRHPCAPSRTPQCERSVSNSVGPPERRGLSEPQFGSSHNSSNELSP